MKVIPPRMSGNLFRRSGLVLEIKSPSEFSDLFSVFVGFFSLTFFKYQNSEDDDDGCGKISPEEIKIKDVKVSQ